MDESRKAEEAEEIIISVIKASGNEALSSEEKQDLWSRIERDTAGPARLGTRRSLWIGIAASVILLMGVFLWLFRDDDTSGLRKLALATKMDFSQGETQIIAGNRTVLSLKGESSVSYGKDGLTVIHDEGGSLTRDLQTGASAYNELVVPYGRRSTLTLADGTKVWLNSGSRLIYPVRFLNDKREVYLQGEAYFQVSHRTDQPFMVQSKDVSIRVLGTEFNLSSYPDEGTSAAALVKGSIELETPGGFWFGAEKQRLRPGELAVFRSADKDLQILTGRVEEATAWKEGYLLLDHVPLRSIAKKLSRYYNSPIGIDSRIGQDETFSGRLILQESMQDVMDILCTGSAYAYHASERRLTLKK